MAIPLYLAKTAAEFTFSEDQPRSLAWMACHFSPYGTGLTNLPNLLPPKSMLILNDCTPVQGHDPHKVFETLEELIQRMACSSLLLDFQRPNSQQTQEIVKTLLALPCPVCVSELYGRGLDCPIFLPPVPVNIPAEKYLSSYANREIWLEAALNGSEYIITGKNATEHIPDNADAANWPHRDDELLCHYRIDLPDDCCRVRMQRTKEDLAALLHLAQTCGVTTAVGLYQELQDFS